MNKIIRSQFHDIVLELTGWDEPNNSRMLLICDLKINGKLENDTYFGDWNRLDERLDKLSFDSPDQRYVYIPAESGGFLIDTNTLNKIQLPYKALSTITFLENYFENDTLVLVYSDEIIKVEISKTGK